MAEAHRVVFHSQPGAFLAAAEPYLTANPVVANVVTTAAHQARARAASSAEVERSSPYSWYATVHDSTGPDGDVVGVAMRTATFPPYPPYVLPMPSQAAAALVQSLHARGEPTTSVYGASPTAERVFQGCTGFSPDDGRIEQERLRLHELGDREQLRNAHAAPGMLRAPRADEARLLVTWLAAFMREADEQAGRPPGTMPAALADEAEVLDRACKGELWVWADAHDEPVHIVGVRGPHLGVARIGPVYTPRDQRGRGYGGTAVAEVTRRMLDGGARVCLYTDLANPTSNALYERLGYVGLMDFVQLRVR